MKKIITLCFLLNVLVVNAQPYFVDTMDTYPIYALPIMGSVFELPNNQGYAVSNFSNYKFNLIYTDLYGHRTGQKSWKMVDSLNSSHSIRSSIKRNDDTYIVATQEKGSCNLCAYGGIYCLNNNLQDTLWAKKYRYNYQGVEYPIYFDFVKVAQDNSIWATGTMAFNANVISHVTHLSANGNIIAQNHFPLTTNRNFANSLLPTTDGGCIIGLTEAQNANRNTNQAAFVKVNTNGVQQWYKSYGNPNYQDGAPFVLQASNSNEYWLVYHEGKTIAINPPGQIKGIRVNNAGVELESKYLAPYTAKSTEIYDAYQDTDGSVVFGMKRLLIPNTNTGYLWKFDANMDSLWLKQLPVPHYDTNYESTQPYHIIKSTNGDYICGGMYLPNSGNNKIFLTRLDSAGCLVVGTESITQSEERKIKIFPNPTNGILNIEIDNFQNKQIIITNTLGVSQKIVSLQSERTNIDTKNLPNGIYYVSMYENNRLIGSSKAVVLHE